MDMYDAMKSGIQPGEYKQLSLYELRYMTQRVVYEMREIARRSRR